MRATGSASSWRRSGDLLGQAFRQRVELGRCLADHVLAAIGGLECGAPHLAPARFVEAAEIFHEAGDQVGLGEQHIDREARSSGSRGFPAADCGFRLTCASRSWPSSVMRSARLMARMTPLIGCLGRCLLSSDRKASQLFLSAFGIRILRRVAPGRVDQHGVVGEPPVAVARAADAGDRLGLTRTGQRKLQAGIDQRRGLAGARRADDDVPGQFVEEVALAARPLERRDGLVHARFEHCESLSCPPAAGDGRLRGLSAPCASARSGTDSKPPTSANDEPMIVARSQAGSSGRVSAKPIRGPANQTAAAKPISAMR